ncbi:MAG: hypothetical protein SGJ11_08040 [Phycisphaerae bacterium]|nr:hypothetical protein [Phycisphaerae bacterium]
MGWGTWGTCHASADSPPSVDWYQATLVSFGWAAFEPSISADGRRIAFRSAFNFTGQNPDVNFEIFLFDRDTEEFTQITQTSVFFGNTQPHITPDGSAVLFRSLYNFTGENPDGSAELFEATVATGVIKQLTFSPGGSMLTTTRLSADGSSAVFLSSADGSLDVMRYRRATGELTAITQVSGFTVDMPAVNGDGSIILFRSKYNFDGSNPEGNFEIWCWQDGLPVVHLTQTPAGKINELPSVDAAGRYVTFVSRANIVGENLGSTREIFIADRFDGSYAQVTPSFPTGAHLEPIISSNGAYVLFESERDPVGLNRDKNRELFRFERATSELSQLTETTGGISIAGMSDPAKSNYVAVSMDGEHFAYRCEHALDPEANDPEPQVNLEAFIGSLPRRGNPLADLDLDGDVDAGDLAICFGAWGPVSNPQSATADLNQDGLVDFADVSILLGAWT